MNSKDLQLGILLLWSVCASSVTWGMKHGERFFSNHPFHGAARGIKTARVVKQPTLQANQYSGMTHAPVQRGNGDGVRVQAGGVVAEPAVHNIPDLQAE
jgi:hypothetical protein